MGDTTKSIKCHINSWSVIESSSHVVILSPLKRTFPQCSRLHHVLLSSGPFLDNLYIYPLRISHQFIHSYILPLLPTCSFIHRSPTIRLCYSCILEAVVLEIWSRTQVHTLKAKIVCGDQGHMRSFQGELMCCDGMGWWLQKLALKPVWHGHSLSENIREQSFVRQIGNSGAENSRKAFPR